MAVKVDTRHQLECLLIRLYWGGEDKIRPCQEVPSAIVRCARTAGLAKADSGGVALRASLDPQRRLEHVRHDAGPTSPYGRVHLLVGSSKNHEPACRNMHIDSAHLFL